MSIATVKGPTPPGTFVTIFTWFFTSMQSTSPTILPLNLLIPTSITIYSELTNFLFIRSGFPQAAIRIFAFFVCSSRFFVNWWQTSTVAYSLISIKDRGRPTKLLLPTMQTFFDLRFTSNLLSIYMTPKAVQGNIIFLFVTIIPT